MSKSVQCLSLAIGILSLAPFAGAEVSFTAVEQVGDWDFGLYGGPNDGTPNASGDASVTAGVEMYWQLAYDGAGLLTYSWGTSTDAMTQSIEYDLGLTDFDYISVATQAKPNSKPTAVVHDLVLQTDLGIFEAEDLESSSTEHNVFTFSFNDLTTFSTFTLNGSTTFNWKGKGSNSDDLAVIITGGNASPVVPEPMSASLVLIGLAALGIRATRQWKRASTPSAVPA